MGLFDHLKKKEPTGGLFDHLKQPEIPIPDIASPTEVARIDQVTANIAKAKEHEEHRQKIEAVSQQLVTPEVEVYHPKPRDILKDKPFITGGKSQAPSIPVEAKATLVPSTKKLLEFVQAIPDGQASAVAITDQQKRAREVFDSFSGDKNALHAKLRTLAKEQKKSAKWVSKTFNTIINQAEALPEGAKVREDDLKVKIPKIELTPGTGIDTEVTVSPKSVLEGGLQQIAATGGDGLEITKGREKVGKTAKVVGDIVEIGAGVLSTGALGKTLASTAKSGILKKAGQLLANPDTNPIPDAAYAALNEGDFSKKFVEGYAINLALGRVIGGKGALKLVKDLPESDRKIMRNFLEEYKTAVDEGKIPAQLKTEIHPAVQKELGLQKPIDFQAELPVPKKAVAQEPRIALSNQDDLFSAVTSSRKAPKQLDVFEESLNNRSLQTEAQKINPKGVSTDVPVKDIPPQRPDLEPVDVDARTGWSKVKGDVDEWVSSFGIRDKLRGLKKSQQSGIKAEFSKLMNESKRFEKAIKGQDRDLINALLGSPEMRNTYRSQELLDAKVLDAVDSMRGRIDDLSIKLKEDGQILSEKLEATVDDNLGIYLKRAYKKFYNRNWWDDVSKETDVLDGAKQWIDQNYGDAVIKRLELDTPGVEITKEVYNQALDAEVKSIATADWTSESMQLFTKWLGSVNRNNLKKRKDIPIQLRKLMGEIDDPVANSVLTAQNMIVQMEQSRTNRAIIDQFMARGKDQVLFQQKRGKFDVPVKIDMGFGQSKTLFTTKEFAKEFKETKINQDKLNVIMMKANGWLKGMQTVNNPASHIRNLVGNTLFATANGHVHVGEMANAIDIVARKGKNEKLVEQLIRGGVLSSDIITSDIADITRKSFGFFTKDVEKMSSKQLNKMISNLPNNIQQRLYQAEDDVWKVYGYLNELKRGYSPKEAMENTKLIYPNYNNLPRVIEKFREIPYVGSAIGTFTAFPTAVVQNAASTLKLATKEMAGKTSLGKRSFGRAVGVGAIGGYYLGRNKFADMYNQMTGGGEAFNEWGMSTDETARLMQKYGSPWEEYAEILPTRIVDLKDGAKGIEYFNNSYLNPWSTVSEPLTALSRGEYSDAAYQALQPYVDPSMLTSMMTALFTGKDDNNKTIRSKHDDSINNVANMVTFMAKRISPWAMAPDILKIKADLKSGDFDISKFVPGTGTYIQGVGYQAQRFQKAADGVVDEYGKKYTVNQEAKNILTGTRKQVFVPRQSMKSNLFTAKDAYNLSMRGAMSKMHNESDSNIIKMYQADGEKYRQGAFNRMREVITDFKKFGMSDEDIRGVLDELNVSNRMKRDLETGVYRPYRPSRKTLKAIRDGREKRNLNKFEFDF